MTYRTDDDYDADAGYDAEEEPERTSPVRLVIVAVLLAMLGAGSAWLWRAYNTASFPSFASGSAAPPAIVQQGVGTEEFKALQQQLTGQMQAAAQLVASQQTEIKRLSDQLAALTAKIDALQRPAAPAPAAKQVTPVRKKPAPAPVAAAPAEAAPPPAQQPAAPLQLNR